MAEIKTSDGLLEFRINQVKNIELKNKGKLYKTNPEKNPSNPIQKPKK